MISKHVLHSCTPKYIENISETGTLLGKQYHLQYNQLFIVFGPFITVYETPKASNGNKSSLVACLEFNLKGGSTGLLHFSQLGMFFPKKWKPSRVSKENMFQTKETE